MIKLYSGNIMNSAILYLKNDYEAELAGTRVFDKFLIDYTVNEIRRLDIDTIYLVGNLDIDNVIRRNSLEEVFNELKGTEGKCILLSPFYPLIEKEDYERLLALHNNAAFIDEGENIVPVFAINNSLLSSYDRLSYDGLYLEEEKLKRFSSPKDVASLQASLKERINSKWLEKGVVIIDPERTNIGSDVFIDKNTVIYPETVIEGRCSIGKNNIIGRACHLSDVVMGDDNRIENSNIKDSIIHNGCQIGPEAIIEEGSEIMDEATVGSFVKLFNTRLGSRSSVSHLSYIGDGQIGEDVKIGSGVCTVNYDGRSRHATIIKAHSTIGSNVAIVAPVVVGEYVMVAAGSTIDADVKDGDLAIARIYQQNKKGYGYKYNKED